MSGWVDVSMCGDMQLCLRHKEVKLTFLSTQWDQETMMRSTNTGMEAEKREVIRGQEQR